jgi:ribose 5-phosphate isomerase B
MKTDVKIGMAADHAGFELKEFLKKYLLDKGFNVTDFGTNSADSSDYADYAHPLGSAIDKHELDLGFSICGSGNGINMVVNKYENVRSALCWNVEIAKLAVEHNNANICALPARFISKEVAVEIVDTFFSAVFEGGRHQRRIDKIPIDKC